MTMMSLNIGTDYSPASVPHWLDKPSKIKKSVLKPIVKTLDWATFTKGKLPEPAKDARKLISRITDGQKWLDIPRNVGKLISSVGKVGRGNLIGEKALHSVGAFKNFTTVASTGACALEICHDEGLLTLSPQHLMVINVIGFLSSLALFLKSAFDITKIFTELKQAKLLDKEFNLNFLNLAIKVCSLVAGFFGMAVFLLTGELATTPMLLGISSFSLILYFSKYYYNRLLN